MAIVMLDIAIPLILVTPAVVTGVTVEGVQALEDEAVKLHTAPPYQSVPPVEAKEEAELFHHAPLTHTASAEKSSQGRGDP